MDGPVVVPSQDISTKRNLSPERVGISFHGGDDPGLSKLNQSVSSQAFMMPGSQYQNVNQFRVNVCQRVEPPKDLHAPPRLDDEEGSVVSEVHAGGDGKDRGEKNLNVNRRQAANTKMRDQEMLAFACRR